MHGFQMVTVNSKRSHSPRASTYLSMIDTRGVKLDIPMIRENDLLFVNLNTRDLTDGTYYIYVWQIHENIVIADTEIVAVIVDNRTHLLDIKVEPSLARSGSEITFSLYAPINISEAYVETENGVRIYLNHNKAEDLWFAAYLIPFVLNEGTHFVTVIAEDSSGKILQSTSSYTVCNSEPFIVFPRDQMNVMRKTISVSGKYRPSSKVFLMLNGKWLDSTETLNDGSWEMTEVQLTEGENEILVFSSQNETPVAIFPYQKIVVNHKRNSLVVLSYHNIASTGNRYTRTAENFSNDLIYLASNGFNTISPALLISYFDGKAELPVNPVLITFDDGYLGVHEEAFPILKKHQVAALFFVLTSRVGVFRDFVTWEQLSEMQSSRVFSIESHTHNAHFYVSETHGLHAALTSRLPLPDGTLESHAAYRNRVYDDLKTSRDLIESKLNKKVHFLSVPFGSANKEVNDIATDLGFMATFNSDGGYNSIPLEPLNIKRVTVTRDHRIEDLVY